MNAKATLAKSRCAVILVFVLLLLAICGITFSQYASKILRMTTIASVAEKEMQLRWGSLSLRRAMLENPDVLIAVKPNSSSISGDTRRVVRLRIRLSDQNYSTQLEDESAKLPLHTLLRTEKADGLRTVIRELAGTGWPLRVELPKTASSWNQVFERKPAVNPRQSLAELQAMVSRMTLYSDGRLNIRRCENKTLDALWRLKYGIAAPVTLQQARRIEQLSDLRSLITASNLSRNESDYLQQVASTESTTYSLWIDGTNEIGNGFTAIYIRRSVASFADDHFGFHAP